MAERIAGEASSSGGSGRGASVVIDRGRRKSSCGYCKSSGYTSLSHGLWARSITADDYQALLDRGWRRSGSFLYKPEMESTCCKSYTIRLSAGDFVASKEQLRVHRRMQRFLDGTLDANKCFQSHDDPDSSKMSGSLVTEGPFHVKAVKSSNKLRPSGDSEDNYNTDYYVRYISDNIDSAINICIDKGELPSIAQMPKAVVKKVNPQTKRKLTDCSGDLLYTSSISFQIAAALRKQQSKGKNVCQAGYGESVELSPKDVAEKLACSLNHTGKLLNFLVKACNGHLNLYSSACQNASVKPTTTNLVVQSSRNRVAYGKRDCIPGPSTQPSLKRRKIEVRMKRSCFDPEEFELYRRYQIQVHNEPPEHVTENSYREFLVDSPIIFVSPRGDKTVPPCGFGSFHQQYVIDGKLVAVGVVDILPKCLSSKYLFWDPDLAFLSLGKYSALREIDWVKETQSHCPSLQYYYLGYYIHSCSKMRYKAAYCPSELLCPLRYQWVPFDMVKPLLDKKPYVVLSDVTRPENKSFVQPSPEDSTEERCVDSDLEDKSESIANDDMEMEPKFDGSDTDLDDDSDPETNNWVLVDDLKEIDVSNMVIELNGSRVKFRDLQRAFGPIEQGPLTTLEQQLYRYAKAVGEELASRMIYSLG